MRLLHLPGRRLSRSQLSWMPFKRLLIWQPTAEVRRRHTMPSVCFKPFTFERLTCADFSDVTIVCPKNGFCSLRPSMWTTSTALGLWGLWAVCRTVCWSERARDKFKVGCVFPVVWLIHLDIMLGLSQGCASLPYQTIQCISGYMRWDVFQGRCCLWKTSQSNFGIPKWSEQKK